jgi:hypothetical protein
MDPDPSYDVSDELEFYFKFLPWGLRGVTDGNGYPPPAYPPVEGGGFYSALSSSVTADTDFLASPNSNVVPSA